MRHLQHILVPVDCTPRSRVAVEHAIALAAAPNDALVDVLHVVPPMVYASVDMLGLPVPHAYDEDQKERALEDLEEFLDPVDRGEARVRPRVEIGDITETILRVEREGAYDLIVVETEGSHGIWSLIQPGVARRVIAGASCPVLIVHPPQEIPSSPRIEAAQ